MTTNFTHKLEIPEDIKDKLNTYLDKNPDIFKVFKNLGTIDVEGVRKQADKIRAERAKKLKEEIESPLKKLKKERKTAAIAELDRLGMKTDENVAMINAIKFFDDKILIGKTPWAYENMKGGTGVFRTETNQHYYNFAERKAEAKKQGIILPTKEDFVDTLKALPGEYSENNWYQGGNILSIILGESRTGYCDSDGDLSDHGKYGSLGSVSEYARADSWRFAFDESEGILTRYNKSYSFVCRPLVKNS